MKLSGDGEGFGQAAWIVWYVLLCLDRIIEWFEVRFNAGDHNEVTDFKSMFHSLFGVYR